MGDTATSPGQNSAAPDMTDVDPLWIRGINSAIDDPRWDAHDPYIRQVLQDYNLYLSSVAGYRPPDFILIKAMCWTETGAVVQQGSEFVDNPRWFRTPMQIGSTPADKGLRDLLIKREAKSRLIVPPVYRENPATRLTMSSVRSSPRLNIAAGVGYLLLLAAHFDWKSVPDVNIAIWEHIVRKGESFSTIAGNEHTTLRELVQDNPEMVKEVHPPRKPGDDITVVLNKPLHPKDIVLFRRAANQWVILKWDLIDESFAANNYNQGDTAYLQKLRYCEYLIRGGRP